MVCFFTVHIIYMFLCIHHRGTNVLEAHCIDPASFFFFWIKQRHSICRSRSHILPILLSRLLQRHPRPGCMQAVPSRLLQQFVRIFPVPSLSARNLCRHVWIHCLHIMSSRHLLGHASCTFHLSMPGMHIASIQASHVFRDPGT